MEAFIGTSDPDEMIKHYKKTMKDLNENMMQSQKKIENQFNGLLRNIGQNNNNK